MTSTSFTIGFGDNSKSSSKVLKPPGGGSSDLFGADGAEPQTPRSMNKNRMQSSIFAAPEGQKAGNGSETPRRAAAGQDSHNRLFGEVDRPYTPAKNHMKSNLPIGSDATDSGKSNGHSNGSSKTSSSNGHHQNGNGVAHTNGHSSNGSNGNTANGHSNGTSTSSAPSQNGSSHIFLRRLTSPKSSSSSTMSSPRSPRFAQRNPVTGNGVEDYADKPRKPSSRGGHGGENGNPVTGEGYKSGGAAEINMTVPSLNGAGHVINKNRIPPGGFSSGLW
ncbi:microtubule-associated protein Jupiter isoform X2 [Ochlerotatus camptorhynchus]|uniref:microtubule-associated protein Jupiter isoform X2 n=1 Tax=Ochlerotatus camptorhynchus TaxID=644619 RepID=UPI0031CF9EC2